MLLLLLLLLLLCLLWSFLDPPEAGTSAPGKFMHVQGSRPRAATSMPSQA